MIARVLADAVVVVHLGFLAFLAVGSIASWRRHGLVWLHLPCVGWAFLSVVAGVECPLTSLEKHLIARSGEAPYADGFIDHHLDGTLYPAAWSPVAGGVVALLAAIGYAGLWWRSRRDRTLAPEAA